MRFWIIDRPKSLTNRFGSIGDRLIAGLACWDSTLFAEATIDSGGSDEASRDMGSLPVLLVRMRKWRVRRHGYSDELLRICPKHNATCVFD
jgi:hypothetical protein